MRNRRPAQCPGPSSASGYPGRGAYVRAVGYSNLSARQPMALDDKFRIGSNTKTFVITVLLHLVDEHKLSLDDPVSRFDIGVKIPNGEHITVRELCQMRSGLIDVYNAPDSDNLHSRRKQSLPRASDRHRRLEPGALPAGSEVELQTPTI